MIIIILTLCKKGGMTFEPKNLRYSLYHILSAVAGLPLRPTNSVPLCRLYREPYVSHHTETDLHVRRGPAAAAAAGAARLFLSPAGAAPQKVDRAMPLRCLRPGRAFDLLFYDSFPPHLGFV